MEFTKNQLIAIVFRFSKLEIIKTEMEKRFTKHYISYYIVT